MRFDSKYTFLQLESFYRKKIFDFVYTHPELNKELLFKNNLDYLSSNISFGWNVLKTFHIDNPQFRLNSGPVFNLIIDEKVSFNEVGKSDKQDVTEIWYYDQYFFGWSFGAYIEFGKIMLHCSYEFSLSNMMKEFHIPNSSISDNPYLNTNILQFTIGYKFLYTYVNVAEE